MIASRILLRSFSKLASSSPGLNILPLGKGIVELQMDSPPVNTFTIENLLTFTKTIKMLEQDPDVKGFVLTSAVPKIYSAGLDLKELHHPTPEDFKLYWSTFEKMWNTYYMSPLATVAAIDGTCPALGAIMALSSDYRVMVNNSRYRFGLNETALGMNPPDFLRAIMAHTIGGRQAEWHLSVSTLADPAEAFEIGFVDQLVDGTEHLMPAAIEKLKVLTSIPDKARGQSKQGFRKPIADLVNHMESVDVMVDSCLGDEFQNTMDGVMERLQSKKKKK